MGSALFSRNAYETRTFMSHYLEQLIARGWNRLAASGNRSPHTGSRLDLGFQVIDGEIRRSRAYLADTKRCEHAAILGKTGQGKSFFLRHLGSQDIRDRRGFVFFDLHGDTMPFLLRLIAAEEQPPGADLSERLIVIEPGDPEFSIGLNVLEVSAGQQSYVQLAEFAQILKSRWHLDSLGARTEELLRNALHVLADNELTLLELSPLLTNADLSRRVPQPRPEHRGRRAISAPASTPAAKPCRASTATPS